MAEELGVDVRIGENWIRKIDSITRADSMKEKVYVKHAWALLFALGVLILVGGVPDSLGINTDPEMVEGLIGMTLNEFQNSNNGFFNLYMFYFRFGGLSDIGVAFFIMAISLTAYRRGERWAWYAMWFVPAFFIGCASITASTITQGFESLFLLIPITMFITWSLVGLLLPIRKFFPRKEVSELDKSNNSMGAPRSLLVVYSYHHKNTEKVAGVMGRTLGAEVKTPEQVDPEMLRGYDLLGFGSGIDSDKHYRPLLDFADKLPQLTDKNAFIFSTSGVTGEAKRVKDHSALREKLESKGCKIVGEFQCKGFNTNSFLGLFGGMNKGRPNADDLKHAEKFAKNVKRDLQSK